MMPQVLNATDPAVSSYLELRKAVGWVALGLPFALIIPWLILGNHTLPTSISGYYYTGMRNLFEGCLCAIALFNLCCRGYDWKDEAAGAFSAVCALGVAFCPTTPDSVVPTPCQQHVGTTHLIFASLLFITLAYFCLVLFRTTAADRVVTRRKRQRNTFYLVCGWAILVSIGLITLCKLLGQTYLIGRLGAMFCFETTALFAFGIAWLVKGETILKDEIPTAVGRP
ncbi:MAG: DUF998 domain-containing protein [Terracidiphilus sp.]|jgi:hypothetical protein